MTAPIALDAARCFVLAARLLNFRAAARAVGLTPAALGKRIQQLEDQLGAPLFHRTTRRVELTEAGMALLPYAQRLLDAAEDCLRAARGELGAPPMSLTLGTRHELGLSWLIPLLPRLREAAPSVTFHLYFGSGQDLEHRVRAQEIDAAISSRQLRDPLLHGERLHVERYTFVASPALLARRPFHAPDDAAAHDLIDAHADLPLFHYWLDAQPGLSPPRFSRVILMGTIAAIHALVLQGEGVAVLPSYLVAPDLARGALTRVLPHTDTREDHFRLLFRHDDPRRQLFLTLAGVMRDAPLC